MSVTSAGFSMKRDMGHEFVERMTRRSRSYSSVDRLLGKAHSTLGLRHDDRTRSERSASVLRQIIHNAFDHVRRHGLEDPWTIDAAREGDDAVWTISDTGAGMLERYVADRRTFRASDDEAEGIEMILSLIHDHRSSDLNDPNAGIGLEIAMRDASRSGCSMRLRTSGHSFVLKNGRMVPSGDAPGIGTTWVVRVPMADRDAPRPRAEIPLPEVAPNAAPTSAQEAVDMAERSLVHWINSAWAGRVPGDARDFRRSAGGCFDQLRSDLGLQSLPPAHEDCAQDDLRSWARFGDHPLDEKIMRIVAEDPAIRRAIAPFEAEAMLSGLVHRLRLLMIEEKDGH